MNLQDAQKLLDHPVGGGAHKFQPLLPPRHLGNEKFLKGPIPWNWLSQAARLKGCSLHVAIALWFLAGLNRNRTVALTNTVLQGLGINRFTKSRALKVLEQARLVSVTHNKGRNPVVTILDVGP